MEYWKNLSDQQLPGEEWRDVTGFRNIYQVSSYGRVRHCPRLVRLSRKNWRQKPSKIIAQRFDGRYLIVGLSDYGRHLKKYVHRLVAEAFIDCNDESLIVNHLNEVKTDNRVENLEWCSIKENTKHGSGIERRKVGRVTGREIGQCSLDGKLIAKFSSQSEASRRTGTCQQSISRCLKGQISYSNGFKWILL